MDSNYLKSLLNYCPETGLFHWLVNKGSKIAAGALAGGLQQNGYVYIKIDGKLYKAHRLAFLYMSGSIPDFVDHIDGVKNNNKWDNLRPATKSQNNRYCGLRKDNKTGFKGVSFHKSSGKFMARCWTDQGRIHIGSFPTAKLAHEARKAFALEHHKEFYHE